MAARRSRGNVSGRHGSNAAQRCLLKRVQRPASACTVSRRENVAAPSNGNPSDALRRPLRGRNAVVFHRNRQDVRQSGIGRGLFHHNREDVLPTPRAPLQIELTAPRALASELRLESPDLATDPS